MTRRDRETLQFATTLAVLLLTLFWDSLGGGKILSPADVVAVQPGFADPAAPPYEPRNRLLMDPVLQFQPWLELNREALAAGRLPLWNPYVGCGAPHLANGQSAVFDPFHLIGYAIGFPAAHAPLAAGRLFVAGLGMFLLGRRWGLARPGRWFAGLTFPFCGFLIGWLLYPVTNVAIWLPWLLLTTDRLLDRITPRRVAALALVTAASALGGHVQTNAHAGLAAALWAAWRLIPLAVAGRPWARSAVAWTVATLLGIGVAAVELVPLGFYLSQSAVWEERQQEHGGPAAPARPRLLDALTTTAPYLYGSQRRGHPNLARGLGVNNLNESAGGFVGLATLIVLVPIGCRQPGRRRRGIVSFLMALGLLGALAAFDIPPVRALLRFVPVLNVMDHRRLVLWVAFASAMLAGRGLDRLRDALARVRLVPMLLGGSLGLGLLAAALALSLVPEARLKARIAAAYAGQVERGELPPETATALIDRQLRNLRQFTPPYLAYLGAQGLFLAALLLAARHGRIGPAGLRATLATLVGLDLALYAVGLNPEIAPAEDRPRSRLIAELESRVPFPDRIVGIGSVLPPNTLLRYRLGDVRNYDSVELRANLDWFEPIFEPEDREGARSSRRTVSWTSAARGLDRLQAARVTVLVGETAPPEGMFDRVERVGSLWLVDVSTTDEPTRWRQARSGEIRIDGGRGSEDRRVLVPVSPANGWIARAAGRPLAFEASEPAFLTVRLPSDVTSVELRYQPSEAEASLLVSAAAAVLALGMLLTPEPSKFAGKPAFEGLEPRERPG